MGWIADYFYQRGRLRGAGRFLIRLAAYWCFVGCIGQVLTAVPAGLQHGTPQTLAKVLPEVPTWWVPEHPLAFILVLAIGMLGFFLSLVGKRLDRYQSA